MRRAKKQKYLDSLMDKAGELNLRCKLLWPDELVTTSLQSPGSVLDAEGNWTADEGRYKKAELCKEYDLDVSFLDLAGASDLSLYPAP
jgi:magnesium transporter